MYLCVRGSSQDSMSCICVLRVSRQDNVMYLCVRGIKSGQ